ncbi:uncharacterized protein EV420DRAFT_1486494 [Desarmillaria tabescens]|uniref:Uncharacterized protein n=1 Tax=Armillaria tabescens TaxID=1929756 RepID=A0AA39JBM8_ARMTA|nr:uncharacterized protein EV420DRAFT_1486494 [Desarmillaria tabescens]KAK0439032.1 hypothetical protein EV420DRAFT_1486494 [Desarmillaria tabescens]
MTHRLCEPSPSVVQAETTAVEREFEESPRQGIEQTLTDDEPLFAYASSVERKQADEDGCGLSRQLCARVDTYPRMVVEDEKKSFDPAPDSDRWEFREPLPLAFNRIIRLIVPSLPWLSFREGDTMYFQASHTDITEEMEGAKYKEQMADLNAKECLVVLVRLLAFNA